MTFYAVIDTNVLVSAILSKKSDSATVKIIKAIVDGKIVPLVHEEILNEYSDVLNRDKFHLKRPTIEKFLRLFEIYGVEVIPRKTDEVFSDIDDKIFYEVAIGKQNSYLVTGNSRHYPHRDFVVTPAEMIFIIENESDREI